MMNYCEIRDINKVSTVVTALKENPYLIGREFTKKEFDAIFKNRRLCSLEWLRNNGIDKDGNIKPYRPRWKDNTVTPFVSLTREEKFEMHYKDGQCGFEQKVVCCATGEIVPNISPKEFTNATVRTVIEQIFGKCKIDMVETQTFIATRNYYRFDIDALMSVNKKINECKSYYASKLVKARKDVDKYTEILALLG